ncbi:hypothetical protein WMO41_00795 [Ventrimonas sp. CLA-AP-H27]|uniref:Uncharacterized protein n=1 Tax=Ventrimonas faecis TaxID=3133170 RepID=A0ABV1HHD8_9FIRM
MPNSLILTIGHALLILFHPDFYVTVFTLCKQQRDFANASHSKSAKSAVIPAAYGIFSSEDSCL